MINYRKVIDLMITENSKAAIEKENIDYSIKEIEKYSCVHTIEKYKDVKIEHPELYYNLLSCGGNAVFELAVFLTYRR